MTDIAVVASPHDAQFAEAVRAGLQASGHEASVTEVLPKQSGIHVVLIWSAALEAAQAIDAQALVGLWSENRLLVVRRDEAPLPLGMRDLPSLAPEASVADVCATVAEAVQGGIAESASHKGEILLSKPDRQRPGAFSRTSSHELPDPEVQRKTSLAPRIVGTLLVAFIALGGWWYYYTASERSRVASITAALEAASRATEELNQAKKAELEAQKRASDARAAEDAARKSGDTAALTAATDARLKAETDAAAQNNLVQQREADVTAKRKTADDAKKAKDDADKRAALEKSKAVEKQAEVAVAPKAEPKAEPVAKAAPKAEPKAEPAEPKAEAPKAPATPKATSRSERERPSDEEAARKALAAGSAPTQVASAPAPSVASTSGADHESLYQQALAIESGGNAKDAIRIYRRAARAGSGKAAKRLGEIYDRGVPGVGRDYAESLQWYEVARQLGEAMPMAGRGGGGSAPVPGATAKAAPPVPVAPTPLEVEAAARAPAPPADSKAALPPPAPEPGPPYAIIIGLLMLVALAIIVWRRSRRSAPVEASRTQPQPLSAGPAPQAPADAATLFVCYSHRDRQRVEPIVSLIEAMGRRVWMDRTGITGQTGWAGQIVRAIRDCRAVVLRASPNSYTSDQVVRELYLAMNHKKPIVPIEIEPADLPDELQYILAPFQHHRLSGRETRDVLGRALAAI